jgi:hypothetical protein
MEKHEKYCALTKWTVRAAVACTFFFLGGTVGHAADAVVALCREPVAFARKTVVLPQNDGSTLNLVVAAAEALPKEGCKSASLGVPLDEVTWLGAMSAAGLDDEGARIAVTVREPGQEIVTLEVEKALAPVIRFLVPRTEILPFDNYRVFGVEERVAAKPDVTAFAIACGAGGKPAGVIFDLPAAMPEAALAIDLTVKASAGFRAEVLPRGEEAAGGIAIPATGEETAMVSVPVPHAADPTLVVTCPEGGGRLRMERGTVAAAVKRELHRPGAWVWEPDVWRNNPAELLDVAAKLGIGRLYVTVPIDTDHVAEPGRLARFIVSAHQAGIQVAAVEGDPAMIFGEGRAQAIERARALAAFDRGATPEARLDGVQYDIEPYFGAAFWARSELSWQRWAETLKQLSAALGERVEAVVPYWTLESQGAQAALEQAAPALNRLTIMAYRTDPAAITVAAAPLLGWASRHDLPADVALESGTLAQENRKVYVKSANGDLHVIRFDDVAAVVVLDRMRAGSTGRTYHLSHIVPGNSARVSFNNNSAAMFKAAAAVAPDLVAWPSTERLAFHGLEEVTPTAVAALAGNGKSQP